MGGPGSGRRPGGGGGSGRKVVLANGKTRKVSKRDHAAILKKIKVMKSKGN